jgi:hypothetical protein
MATPNLMTPSYGCNRASLGQGVGALVQDHFARHSQRPSAALFPKFRG